MASIKNIVEFSSAGELFVITQTTSTKFNDDSEVNSSQQIGLDASKQEVLYQALVAHRKALKKKTKESKELLEK